MINFHPTKWKHTQKLADTEYQMELFYNACNYVCPCALFFLRLSAVVYVFFVVAAVDACSIENQNVINAMPCITFISWNCVDCVTLGIRTRLVSIYYKFLNAIFQFIISKHTRTHTFVALLSGGYHCDGRCHYFPIQLCKLLAAARRRLCHLRVYTRFIVYVYRSMLSNVCNVGIGFCFCFFFLFLFFSLFTMCPSLAFNFFN